MKFELVIIGSGSAAFAAAIKASELGAKSIAVIDRGIVGGTCVNVGCVPSKHFLAVGEAYRFDGRFKSVKRQSPRFSMQAALLQKRAVVSQLRNGRYIKVLKGLKYVTLFKGTAKFVSRNELIINGKKKISGEKFIIATGSSSWAPPVPGLDKIGYWTNIEALEQKKAPKSLIVVGGRALGLEFAQMYRRFGTKVTLLQRSPRILPDDELELADLLAGYLRNEGISIRTNIELVSARKEGKLKVLEAKAVGKPRVFKAEQVLMATGRRPNTAGLGLDKAGVKVYKDGAIIVNGQMKTSALHIWAAGDVLGEPMLETVAAKEGSTAAENAIANAGKRMDFSAISSVVFTDPQFASVGLTEAQAEQKGFVCSCRTLPMELVPKAAIISDVRGAAKLVVDNRTQRILGVHILSTIAGDLITIGTLAIKNKMTLDKFIDTMFAFPTLSESLKLAAQAFKRDISKMSCCVE
jgi:mercuric reductase